MLLRLVFCYVIISFAPTILVYILNRFTDKEVYGDVSYEYYLFDNNTAWNILPNKVRYYDYNFLNSNFFFFAYNSVTQTGRTNNIYSFPRSVPSTNFGFRFSAVITIPDTVQLGIYCGDCGRFSSFFR